MEIIIREKKGRGLISLLPFASVCAQNSFFATHYFLLITKKIRNIFTTFVPDFKI
jgi:hypothetical protein